MKQFQIIFNKYFDFLKRSNSGMTMMEIILSIGLFGLVAVMGARFFGSSIGTQEHIIVRGEVEDVRDLIRSSIDCDKTMINQVTACGTSQYIEIRKQDNTVLIPKVSPFGAMGGGVEVRSKCSTGDGFYKLDMEYRRVANGAVIKDQMNGKMYDWAPLFNSVPISCPNVPCKNSTFQSISQDLFFKKPQASCQWNSSGNSGKAGGRMTARTLQTVEASLPVGAILCGMQLKSQSGTLRYDDAFFLIADGYMILNSWNSFTHYFEKEGSLVKWSWDRIVGKGYVTTNVKPFCFGSAKSCVVPPTETVGSFDVRFGDDDIFGLGQKIANDGKIDFTLATTGDDDPGSDCMHSDLTMRVTFHYIK